MRVIVADNAKDAFLHKTTNTDDIKQSYEAGQRDERIQAKPHKEPTFQAQQGRSLDWKSHSALCTA